MLIKVGLIVLVVFAYARVGNGKKTKKPALQIDTWNILYHGGRQVDVKVSNVDVHINKRTKDRVDAATLDDIIRMGSGQQFRISTLMNLLGEDDEKKHRSRGNNKRRKLQQPIVPEDAGQYDNEDVTESIAVDQYKNENDTESIDAGQYENEDDTENIDASQYENEANIVQDLATQLEEIKPDVDKMKKKNGPKKSSSTKAKNNKGKNGRKKEDSCVEMKNCPLNKTPIAKNEKTAKNNTPRRKNASIEGQKKKNYGGSKKGPSGGRSLSVKKVSLDASGSANNMKQPNVDSNSGSGFLNGLGNGAGKLASTLGGALGTAAVNSGEKINQLSKLKDSGFDLISGIGKSMGKGSKSSPASNGGSNYDGQRPDGDTGHDHSQEDTRPVEDGAAGDDLIDVQSGTNLPGRQTQAVKDNFDDSTSTGDDISNEDEEDHDDSATRDDDIDSEQQLPDNGNEYDDAEVPKSREPLPKQDEEDNSRGGGDGADAAIDPGKQLPDQGKDHNADGTEEKMATENLPEKGQAKSVNATITERPEQDVFIEQVETTPEPSKLDGYKKNSSGPGTSHYCTRPNEMEHLYAIPSKCCRLKYECPFSVEYPRKPKLGEQSSSMNRLRECSCDLEFYECLIDNETYRQIHPILLFANDKCVINKFHRKNATEPVGYKLVNTASYIAQPFVY